MALSPPITRRKPNASIENRTHNLGCLAWLFQFSFRPHLGLGVTRVPTRSAGSQIIPSSHHKQTVHCALPVHDSIPAAAMKEGFAITAGQSFSTISAADSFATYENEGVEVSSTSCLGLCAMEEQ